MKRAVKSFKVSKSLLQDDEGQVCKSTVQFCYEVKKVLNTSFRQWRISVTPERMSVKLMDSRGKVVLDADYSEPSILADWESVLAYDVMAWIWVDVSSFFPQPA